MLKCNTLKICMTRFFAFLVIVGVVVVKVAMGMVMVLLDMLPSHKNIFQSKIWSMQIFVLFIFILMFFLSSILLCFMNVRRAIYLCTCTTSSVYAYRSRVLRQVSPIYIWLLCHAMRSQLHCDDVLAYVTHKKISMFLDKLSNIWNNFFLFSLTS